MSESLEDVASISRSAGSILASLAAIKQRMPRRKVEPIRCADCETLRAEVDHLAELTDALIDGFKLLSESVSNLGDSVIAPMIVNLDRTERTALALADLAEPALSKDDAKRLRKARKHKTREKLARQP